MVPWLRAFVFYIFLYTLTPIYSILAVLLFPLPTLLRARIISTWANVLIFLLRVCCNLSFEVRGKENIPQGPAIILSKHQSAWETIALQVIFPPQIWVLKKELTRIPFLGWAFVVLGAIAINRSAGREALKQLVEQGKDRLQRGLWVVIFPEGTRTPPGTRGKYHIGGAWLATHTGTCVVPVAHNAGVFWPRQTIAKNSGTITVSIGEPIETSDLKADALNKMVEDWIETEMEKLPHTP